MSKIVETPARLEGKVCLVTGATSGIGRAAALGLASRGANLVLVGRNEGRGRRMVNTIRSAKHSGQVEFIRTDLSSQSEVRSLAGAVKGRYGKLDVLINNAGARFDSYGQTVDGLERTFGTNHLGHFLLSCLLLDCLLAAPAARVLTVASGSHSANAEGDWQVGEQNYNRRMVYAKSKLANILFAVELARRLQPTRVTSNAVNPGGVASNFARNNGLFSWLRHLAAQGLLQRQLVLPRRAAEGILHLVAASALEGVSGKYFYAKRQVSPAPAAVDPEAARQLWTLSVQLTGLSAHMGPSWSLVCPDPQGLGSAFAESSFSHTAHPEPAAELI